jgi:adenine-specific DNA-methyltransferase
MNSLLERELMAGKVQCIYFDPPYGIRYGSNFQPFTNKRDVKDGDDGSLTREPEQIRAFRDTWELGIHSYLTYIRDRLLLMREMLTESGSIFVQISDENVHRVRTLMDEVFGGKNYISLISFKKTGGLDTSRLPTVCDYIIWYSKDSEKMKYRPIYIDRRATQAGISAYRYYFNEQGDVSSVSFDESGNPVDLPTNADLFQSIALVSQGASANSNQPFEYKGRSFRIPSNKHWRLSMEGLSKLAQLNRLIIVGDNLRAVSYLKDFPWAYLNNTWTDTGSGSFLDAQAYVVQTVTKVIQRCLLMTTDPGDLIFDPTCGSGTSAYVAEQWGRRWITCDTSRVALALARQRLMTATFPMYKLAHPEEGVKGAFIYKIVPHVTLGSLAYDEPPETETLYDQPERDNSAVRVAGPFTVEAVQPPALDPDAVDADHPSPAVGGEGDAASYIDQMLEQLRRSGLTIRGQHVPVSRVSPLIGGVLHAEADYAEAGKTLTAAVLFGPQYGPLTSAMLQEALNEARGSYGALIACGFNFDAPAHALMQKATLKPPIIGVAINADLLMGNLLKTSKSSQVFSVFGKPDVALSPPGAEGYTVTVRGVDVYDPNTGDFEASSADQVAAWFLDTDYDGATFLVRQAYFPSQTPNPWERISKALKGSVDPDQFAALQRTTSLPFKAGKHRQCAVKVIDNRGNEVMTVLRVQ